MSIFVADKYWKYFKTLLIVYAFYSLHCWPFFSASDMVMKFVFLVFLLPFVSKPYWEMNPQRTRIAVILEILLLYVAGLGNINLYIFTIIGSLPLICLVFLKEEYLVDLLSFFQKILVPILALGTVFWIAHLFGYDLPYEDIEYGVKEDSDGNLVAQYTFENHYIYLVNTSWMLNLNSEIPTYFRFCSIFLEPGYTAILVMYLLFINQFDVKDRRNQVYLLTLVLTLSLAGYLMTLFAFIAHKLQTSTRRIYVLVGLSIFLTIGYFFFLNYNDGHNAINEAVIERLQYDEENGIAGNNRTSEAMDDQFDAFLVSSDVIFGVRNSKLLEYGVGYKPYLVKNGIIGMVLFIMFLLYIAKIKNNYRSYILMILYLMMFARGQSSMFWVAVILVYMSGVMKSDEQVMQGDKRKLNIA